MPTAASGSARASTSSGELIGEGPQDRQPGGSSRGGGDERYLRLVQLYRCRVGGRTDSAIGSHDCSVKVSDYRSDLARPDHLSILPYSPESCHLPTAAMDQEEG